MYTDVRKWRVKGRCSSEFLIGFYAWSSWSKPFQIKTARIIYLVWFRAEKTNYISAIHKVASTNGLKARRFLLPTTNKQQRKYSWEVEFSNVYILWVVDKICLGSIMVLSCLRFLHSYWLKTGSYLLQPFYSQDLISNSPYYLPYNSCDVSSGNLVLDQLIIP